jgi:hypothetical protein
MQWSDRAIMIGSAISGTAIAMNIVNSLVVWYYWLDLLLNIPFFKENCLSALALIR